MITFTGDLSANLRNLDPKIRRQMSAAVSAYAPRIETDMKNRAPWTDRTGNARSGLFSEAHQGSEPYMLFGHSVPYGIFLETRFSGAYAVVLPALHDHAPKFMAFVSKLIFRG